MKRIFLMFMLCAEVLADAFHEGYVIGQGHSHMDSIESIGIPISDNPSETQYNDEHKLAGAREGQHQNNEAFQMIKEGNKVRKSYDIDVELPEINEIASETADAVEDSLGQRSNDHQEARETIYKTCIKNGETYTKTCRRQRIVDITVTLEVKKQNPTWCIEHWANKAFGTKYKCDGCRGGDWYISQHKKVDITRDEWVGCEDFEQLHDLGQAEVISEEFGAANETRIIDGEPITKDYWEATRTYALNTDRFNTCEPLKSIGCTQHDSECQEYTTGMTGERICKRYKLTYACQAIRSARVSKRPDLDAMLPSTQTGVANANMYQALSQMEAMRQMSKHMEGGEYNLRIFRGIDNRCSINFGGAFKNCCVNDGGFGTRMHIATSCTVDEKKLAEARSKKLCIFVGSRVKKKVLGVVVSKENVFCCYPTKLGFAIQRGARAQLGKDFGSAESPHCEGLTPDELSRVDFSQIDLSDTFADIAASAQKMEREIKVDLAQKQQHFEKPSTLSSVKTNQPRHKVVKETGERHEIVY